MNQTKSADTTTKPESQETHRLSVGDVFIQNGVEHVVWFVNDSRASISPLDSQLEYRTREEDGKIQFLGKNASHISPNSDLKIERKLGRKGLAELLEKRKTNEETKTTTESKTPKTKMNTPTTKKEKKEKKESTGTPGIRAGKLGTFEGFSVASVIRTFAKHGWTFAECKAFLDKQKIAASDQTIKLNIYRGTRGIDGEYAPLKESRVKELRPKLPATEKPKKDQAKSKSPAPEKKSKTAKPAAAPTKAKTGKPTRAAEQLKALKEKAA